MSICAKKKKKRKKKKEVFLIFKGMLILKNSSLLTGVWKDFILTRVVFQLPKKW